MKMHDSLSSPLVARAFTPTAADKAFKGFHERESVKNLWILLGSILAFLTVIRSVRLVVARLRALRPPTAASEKDSFPEIDPGTNGRISWRRISPAVASAFRSSSTRTCNVRSPALGITASVDDMVRKLIAAGAKGNTDAIDEMRDLIRDQFGGRNTKFSLALDEIDRELPAFKAAQSACQHLFSGGGPGAPPSAYGRAKMLVVSECMRAHGVTLRRVSASVVSSAKAKASSQKPDAGDTRA